MALMRCSMEGLSELTTAPLNVTGLCYDPDMTVHYHSRDQFSRFTREENLASLRPRRGYSCVLAAKLIAVRFSLAPAPREAAWRLGWLFRSAAPACAPPKIPARSTAGCRSRPTTR